LLYNESGGHRIQRVPPTERKGRVHTSTVTVAIVDPSTHSAELKESDLKIEWFSGTGAGGQNRNKVKNSCRITHSPTGMVATAQTRDRINSKRLALTDIEKRVNNHFSSIAAKGQSDNRKSQVGSGMRGDKIRTYRFQDDIVTDHKTGKRDSVRKILSGNFDLLW
jgi:peptide chain release factor 1